MHAGRHAQRDLPSWASPLAKLNLVAMRFLGRRNLR